MSRHLAWERCYNARDLGGLPTGDGRQTRWRAIVRSDYLNRLTEAGRQALLDYGIKTVIDLRAAHQVAREPAVTIQHGGRPLDYFNLPLDRFDPHVGTLIGQARSRGEVYTIILDHYPDAVASVMQAIVEARPGGVVIHCQAGKDRTGIVVGLLLHLVGVPVDVIAADYAESQARLWPIDASIQAEARERGETSFWFQPTVTEDMMVMMLEHVDAQHGGAEPYLRAAGVSPEAVEQLQRRLLG